jgi:hypothetical protein
MYITQEEIYELTVAAVARGEAYMDATFPQWYWNIEPDHFAMKESTHCVLGSQGDYYQLVGEGSETDTFSGMDRWESDHGFISVLTVDGEEDLDDYDDYPQLAYQQSWDALQEIWEKRIQERRNADPQ